MICIYCRQEKSLELFNREHVLPEGFGHFSDALVLHEAVCTECNQHFGDTLDFLLARSSSEGLERYTWHVKPKDEVEKFRYGEVLIHLSAPGSDWDDALVRKVPTDTPGESRIELVPQAVFKKKDGSGLMHVPLWELRRGDWRADESIDPTLGVRVLAPADLYDEVIAVLAEHGVSFNTHTPLPAPQAEDGEFSVRQLFSLSNDLQRAVAKIAFNYLAKTNGTAKALRPEFDAVRAFIRNGTKPDEPIVAIIPTTRLGIAQEDGQVPVAHYLTVEFDDTETAFLGHVTLFHWAVYQVVLAERIGVDLDLASSGHLYNVGDMTCYEMARKPRR